MKAVARLRTPLSIPAPSARFVAAVAAAPLLLLLARLLPVEGPGLALRLAAAAACVLLLPGALVLRAIGWPDSLGVAAAGALAVSLALLFLGLAATFALGASLRVALAVLLTAALAALIPAARRSAPAYERADAIAAGAVVLAGVAFGTVVWWVAALPEGDALFHLARARKVAELSSLDSVNALNEFRDGGLHPGYAFPLWHGALAAIARLADVDTRDVVVHVAAVLSPLAFLVSYGAGAALFRSWVGGVAGLLAFVALVGFSNAGTGTFAFLALPPTTTRLLLVPAALALAFAFVTGGRYRLLLPLACVALAVAVVHPTYAIFIAIPVAGFLVARLVLAWTDRATLVRVGLALAAIAVPSGLFFLWLLPVVRETAAQTPPAAAVARQLGPYAGQVYGSADSYRLAPEAITRTGPVAVAALIAVPLAAFASRRLWAALVLGGSLVTLALLLVPALFTSLSDAVSLSQSRRLAGFLPLPFALAGAAVVLGRLKLAGVALALAAAIVLDVLYSGEFTYRLVDGGPAWPVWVALAGGLAALAAGALVRREGPEPGLWAVAVAVAFVVPVAVTGFADVERAERRDAYALTPGVVAVLRDVPPGGVVFSNLESAYRVAAYTTLAVNAAPPAHVGDTESNRPAERRRDVIRFFSRGGTDAERDRILTAYEADWLLVDKWRPYPIDFVTTLEPVYEDSRYALFRVRSP